LHATRTGRVSITDRSSGEQRHNPFSSAFLKTPITARCLISPGTLASLLTWRNKSIQPVAWQLLTPFTVVQAVPTIPLLTAEALLLMEAVAAGTDGAAVGLGLLSWQPPIPFTKAQATCPVEEAT
jgi:hypothetical protein